MEGDACAVSGQAELPDCLVHHIHDSGADERVIGKVADAGAAEFQCVFVSAGSEPLAEEILHILILGSEENDVIKALNAFEKHAHGAGVDLIVTQGSADVDLAHPADEDAGGSGVRGGSRGGDRLFPGDGTALKVFHEAAEGAAGDITGAVLECPRHILSGHGDGRGIGGGGLLHGGSGLQGSRQAGGNVEVAEDAVAELIALRELAERFADFFFSFPGGDRLFCGFRGISGSGAGSREIESAYAAGMRVVSGSDVPFSGI